MPPPSGPKHHKPRNHGGRAHGQQSKNGKSGSHSKSQNHKGDGQQAGKHSQQSHETRHRHQSRTDHGQQKGSPSGQGHCQGDQGGSGNRRTGQVGGGKQTNHNPKKNQKHQRGQSESSSLRQPQQQQQKQQEQEILSVLAYDAEDEIDVDESEDTITDESPQEVARGSKMEEENHNVTSGSNLPRLSDILANNGLEILRTLLERQHQQGRQQQEQTPPVSGASPPKNQTWQAWLQSPHGKTPWSQHNHLIQESGARAWAQGQQRRLDEEQARLYTLSIEAAQMESMITWAHEVYQQQQQQPPQPHEARVPPPPSAHHLGPSPSPSPPPPPSASTVPFQHPNTHLKRSPPPSTRPSSAWTNPFPQQPTHRDKLLILLDRTSNLLTALHHSEELFVFRALNTSNAPHPLTTAQQRERNVHLNELTLFFRSAETTVQRAGQRVQAALQRADDRESKKGWAPAAVRGREEEEGEMQFLAAWEGVVRVFGEEVWPMHGRIARRMGVERDWAVGVSGEEWEGYGRVLGAWKGWVDGLGLGL